MATKKQIADLHASLTADVKQYVDAMMAAGKSTRDMERNVTGSMQKAARSTKTFNDAQNVMGRSSRANGMMIQQAGYQVGDFAVQVASGQSAMRAFIQQGSQMLGVFGPAGAIAGAGLAIGGVIYNLITAGDKTKEAREQMEAYEVAAQKLGETMAKIRFDALSPEGQRDALQQRIEKSKSEIRELFDMQETLRAAQEAMGRAEITLGPTGVPLVMPTGFDQAALDRNMAEIGAKQNELLQLQQDLTKIEGTITAAATKAQEAAQKRTLAEQDEWQKIGESIAASLRAQDEEIAKYAQGIRDAMDPAQKFREELERIAALEQAGRLSAGEARFQRDRVQGQIDEVEIARINDSGALNFFDGLDEKSRQNFERMKSDGKAWEQAMTGMFMDVSNRAGDAFANMVLTGENAFKSLADTIAQQMLRIVAQMAIINPILNMVFGGFGSWKPLATFFRADGGPVESGRSYIVGERGPELFTPGASGQISSNDRLLSATMNPTGGNTYYIDATGADQGAVERIAQALQLLAGPGVVERRAMTAITNNRRRGSSGFVY
ncbi:MAG: hypothetical protein H3C27_01090 [Opitutaceae bacterium]|nr:hypothetical protein [Opitutaceae bacterium]